MRKSLSYCLLSCLVFFGCSGDDGPSTSLSLGSETGIVGDGDGDPSTTTGDGDGDGDPTTTGDGDGDPSTSGDGDGDGDGDPSTSGDGDGDPTTTGDGDGDPGGPLEPPAGMSSGGEGGGPAAGTPTAAGNINYHLIAPATPGPHPLMIIYSGVEGGNPMTQNILMVKDFVGAGDWVFAILDGVTYNGNGQAGATVLDAVRDLYDIDNDRTYLLSESAGTSAGLELGFDLRPSYFAAYWANDVNTSATPSMDAAALGFQPFGNAGPGGNWPDADAIVDGMMAADYRTPAPAPYDGPGANMHGSTDQFIAALQWFPGKTRQ